MNMTALWGFGIGFILALIVVYIKNDDKFKF